MDARLLIYTAEEKKKLLTIGLRWAIAYRSSFMCKTALAQGTAV